MRGKGGQQNIYGPKPLQETYKTTSRLTNMECYTPRVCMSSSKVMLYTGVIGTRPKPTDLAGPIGFGPKPVRIADLDHFRPVLYRIG
jgi:hypothetical protein